ncbi:MAG: xanthine dehydrogenase accessory protein XdhC [Gammaproteobacteria bacterium]|nr:xanthine dehydrogenase accessory protein XdhC [Gammaproteobacteria bacterium]
MNFIEAVKQELRIQPGVLVKIVQTWGSVPREAGSWMVVFQNKSINTIGGGHLEWQVSKVAREYLQTHANTLEYGKPWYESYILGVNLGQCCGGKVSLEYQGVNTNTFLVESLSLGDQWYPLVIFGAGHVAHAIVDKLAGLHFKVWWYDSRFELGDDIQGEYVYFHQIDPIESAVTEIPSSSAVLIMTHSHQEDFEILRACLIKQRTQAEFPYLGLIGSKTKWASFQSKLLARGVQEAELKQVVCPIGIETIKGKEPDVIAIAVIAQLLTLPDYSV